MGGHESGPGHPPQQREELHPERSCTRDSAAEGSSTTRPQGKAAQLQIRELPQGEAAVLQIRGEAQPGPMHAAHRGRVNGPVPRKPLTLTPEPWNPVGPSHLNPGTLQAPHT